MIELPSLTCLVRSFAATPHLLGGVDRTALEQADEEVTCDPGDGASLPVEPAG